MSKPQGYITFVTQAAPLILPLTITQAFVEDLCLILDSNYWERPHWKQIKPSVSQLCDGIASYVEHLSQKNKRAKINHRSPTTIRELSDNMIKYFESIPESDVLQIHKPIDDLLANQLPYSPLSIQEHIPDNPVKKYRFLNLLDSSGLSNSCMLLMYNPGSNLGKIAFIWNVPEVKISLIIFKGVNKCSKRLKILFLYIILVQ